LGGCPINNDPVALEKQRDQSVKLVAGTAPAPSRPALGFDLDKATLADVSAWATSRGVSCKSQRDDTLLECTNVAVEALPDAQGRSGTIEELTFWFRNEHKVLMDVSALETRQTADAVRAGSDQMTAYLTQRLGQPQVKVNSPETAIKGKGSYVLRYNFSDYLADYSVSLLPGAGLMVRESYKSAKSDS
jgi:hypothetical protein